MTDREYDLAIKLHDYAIKLIDLKQENTKLKKQLAGHEKPKQKRKFRAMTIKEHCSSTYCQCCEYRNCLYCELHGVSCNELYKTKNGKYIFMEVKK